MFLVPHCATIFHFSVVGALQQIAPCMQLLFLLTSWSPEVKSIRRWWRRFLKCLLAKFDELKKICPFKASCVSSRWGRIRIEQIWVSISPKVFLVYFCSHDLAKGTWGSNKTQNIHQVERPAVSRYSAWLPRCPWTGPRHGPKGPADTRLRSSVVYDLAATTMLPVPSNQTTWRVGNWYNRIASGWLEFTKIHEISHISWVTGMIHMILKDYQS